MRIRTVMSATPAARVAHPRLPAAAYAGAFLALAAVYTALYAASGEMTILRAARGALVVVAPGALLGLVSLALARRRPGAVEGAWALAVRFALVPFALAVASTAAWIALYRLDTRIVYGAVRPLPPTIAVWQTVINTLVQLAIAGLGYAWYTAEALRVARERAARAEVLQARAELELLRSQLQPHFVLNVLHALVGLVRREPDLAESALERLGELLRFGQRVHQSAGDWIPLSSEWDFTKSYLELERMRLGDRLRLALEADPSALVVSVPPFALQPLVENAIVHAVAPRAAGGRVMVSARRADGRLRLEVEDDGPGASADQIAASPRLGLRLLQERLAALYAGRARLDFETPAGGGLRARLDLPDDGVPEPA